MILAIETSCDESALALFDPERGLVRELVHTQIALHERYGGVVPDLAVREHLRNLPPLLQRLHAGDGLRNVTSVAVTHGPGLAGCLAIGLAAAKALALDLRVPLAGVNHLRGHAWSPFISLHAGEPGGFTMGLAKMLPHLGLIVSGGNTLLFEINRRRRITVLSSTRDDAAGEALDKGAKLLGLGYPGGPLVEQRAAAGRADAYDFPRGVQPNDDLSFSFSGLKTSLRYLVEKMSTADVTARLDDLCASYQQAVIDALAKKTATALERSAYASLGLSGGVANNLALRGVLEAAAKARSVVFLAAQPQHTGDNAGMIAFAAWCDPTGCTPDEHHALTIAPSLPLAPGRPAPG
ncbi:MAG: tRNA (adenosine(37)-N6)-threonylcarbamoyltransferase complex transferase subunit TsaD [Verrucomicrobia bacterium RIFCSPLOWO2_12_FULL_64_8]|nr:MAG: tRNA (adenosine(37)-N6)-threonylcarbamoyltransferase complex transferase subunit TsaD [Verrucomicrobia bacterium RIFCSPLOWO2_12_FULL_64_8]